MVIFIIKFVVFSYLIIIKIQFYFELTNFNSKTRWHFTCLIIGITSGRKSELRNKRQKSFNCNLYLVVLQGCQFSRLYIFRAIKNKRAHQYSFFCNRKHKPSFQIKNVSYYSIRKDANTDSILVNRVKWHNFLFWINHKTYRKFPQLI